MSYEDQLIREVTGQNRDFCEPEPEETNDSNETGDQQGKTRKENNDTKTKPFELNRE